MSDVFQGRLDEAAAHLAVAETYVEAAPPDRQGRLRVAIVSLKLWLARRRGHLAGVIEQASFLASPVSGQSDEDIALGSDLRAVALLNLGTLEAWSLGLPDAERHLQEGAALARRIGRPYLEVSREPLNADKVTSWERPAANGAPACMRRCSSAWRWRELGRCGGRRSVPYRKAAQDTSRCHRNERSSLLIYIEPFSVWPDSLRTDP